MKKLYYLIVLALILGLVLTGCFLSKVGQVPPSGQNESMEITREAIPKEINLIAGQHTVAGLITVSNDDENLFITYETVDSWLLNKTHLYIGQTVPTNSAPGKFPYKHKKLGGVTTDTYEIPLVDLWVGFSDTVYIAAHAELTKEGQKEGGWAEGAEIRPGKNWAMYFEYQLSWDEFSDYEKIAITTDRAIHEFVANCEIYGEEQAKQMIIDSLLGKEGVINAGIGIDNESIWFQWENGIISSFSEYPEPDEQQKGFSRSLDNLEIITDLKGTRNTPENTKAIIFDWENTDANIIQNKIIQNELESGGYEVKYCSKSKSDFTLYELENIHEYGVIYIDSHGAGDNEYGIKILTGEEISEEVMNYFSNKYGSKVYATMIGWHTFYENIGGQDVPKETVFCFYPNFVNKIALLNGYFPNSLVYFGTCYGFANTSMADAFITKGAYAYCGYTGTSYSDNDVDMSVFHYLLYGGWDLLSAISYSMPTPPLNFYPVHFYPEDHGDLYLVSSGQEKFPEIGAWTITGYDPYCIKVFGTENIPDRSILVYWPPIVGAEEYRVYRSVNGNSNFSLVYSGDYITDELDVDDRVGWYDFDTTPGNSYSYKVSCVINGQESATSDPVTRSVWLPECSLVSPPDYNPEDPYDQTVIEPDPLLEWNPVGISSYPHQGDIQSGESQIWVVAYDTNYPEPDQGEQIWEESFNNMITSSVRFDPNMASTPLVPGSDHIYAWETKGIGYDYNSDIIAMSWSGARHFFYILGSTGPVHNLTQRTYYDTIQAALDDADNDNTIEVADGTYDESITFPPGKKIILQSVNGPSSTIIRGEDDLSTVTFNNYSDTPGNNTLEGFTITHESGLNGGGIYVRNVNLDINNCTISGNSTILTGGVGGGISIYDSILTITGSTISNNTNAGGAGGGAAGIYNNGSTLTITDSVISGNSGGGGIINVLYSTLTITSSTISNNTAEYDGGGINNCNNSTLTITSSTISNNSAIEGGGIYLSGTGTITIGGSSNTDTSNFNEFINNYKTGDVPSPDQHICNFGGDCHMDYPYNYYNPDTTTNLVQAEITNIGSPSGDLIDPFEFDKWYMAVVYISVDYNGPDSGIIEVKSKPDSGIEYDPNVKEFPYDKYTLGGSRGFDYQFVGSGTTRELTFELYDQATGIKLDEYTSETLHLMQPDPNLDYIESVPSSTSLQKLHFFFFGSDYLIKAYFNDGHIENWTDYNKFLFESSNEDIAYVEEHGAIGGIGVGTATITITYKEDTSKKAYLSVTVY